MFQAGFSWLILIFLWSFSYFWKYVFDYQILIRSLILLVTNCWIHFSWPCDVVKSVYWINSVSDSSFCMEGSYGVSMMSSQQISRSSPLWVSYGMSVVKKKIDWIIIAPDCIIIDMRPTISVTTTTTTTTIINVIQCDAVITWPILSQILKKTPHSSPIRSRYGVSFVDSQSDSYSASVPVIIHVISYNIGPHYNGIRLYHISIMQTSQMTGYWQVCTTSPLWGEAVHAEMFPCEIVIMVACHHWLWVTDSPHH